MTRIASFGTYLPPWGSRLRRRTGPDEDAVTLAVAAGRAALSAGSADRVVLVTRDLPLLEGGSGAALLAGLGLGPEREVVERTGGAPATLDAVTGAAPGTLVIAVDLAPAGAAAALVSRDDAHLEVRSGPRLARSLPVVARGTDGVVHEYDDPRLLRERGLATSLALIGAPDDAVALAGATPAEARRVCRADPPQLPTLGASSALFALAALPPGTSGSVLAVDQATVGGVAVTGAGTAAVHREELPARDVPVLRTTPGPEIPISLPAYDRAFIPKLTLQAGRTADGDLVFPPRRGHADGADPELVPLPRLGTVYTTTTVEVPVPGVPTPYSLVIVELDGVGVRVLCRTTGCAAGEVAIGDRGRMVLRRVAVRSGVPDYQYAFLPDPATGAAKEAA